MLAKAEQRKFELERAKEVQILKQIEAEKEVFGEMPQYTTSKYKEHLQERKQWEDKQDRLDSLDQDVTTRDMSAFHYANYANRIGDRLADSDPLKVAEGLKTASLELPGALPSGVTSAGVEKASKPDITVVLRPGEAPQRVGPAKEEEPEVARPLTRAEKVEAARERYFARKAKKQAQSAR